MVATVAALADGRAPKFAAPHHECVLQKPTRLQVAQQPGDGFVYLGSVVAMVALETTVRVPLVRVRGLHEAHAGLGKAPRKQALRAEVARLGVVHAVQFFGGLALAGKILYTRRLALHTEGQLKACDTCLQRVVATAFGKVLGIHLSEQVQFAALLRTRDSFISDEWNPCLGRRNAIEPHARAVMMRGQKR